MGKHRKMNDLTTFPLSLSLSPFILSLCSPASCGSSFLPPLLFGCPSHSLHLSFSLSLSLSLALQYSLFYFLLLFHCTSPVCVYKLRASYISCVRAALKTEGHSDHVSGADDCRQVTVSYVQTCRAGLFPIKYQVKYTCSTCVSFAFA